MHRLTLLVTLTLNLVVILGLSLAPRSVAEAGSPEFGTRFAVPGPAGSVIVTGDASIDRALAHLHDATGGETTIVMRIGAEAPPLDGARTVASRADADDDDLVATIRAARGALLVGDDDTARPLVSGTALHHALRALLDGGGVVVLTGDLARAVSDDGGLALLPGYVVRTSADADDLDAIIDRNDGAVGIRLDAGASLITSGRRGRIGGGRAFVRLARTVERPARVDVLRPGATIDLVALSRAAVARAAGAFPAAAPAAPEVAGEGTIFIGGGGRLPGSIMPRFIDAAGGPEALIVVIPTALGGADGASLARGDVAMLRRSGARRVVVRHATTPRDAETDEFLDPLRRAGAIWFSGGRQWRLVDSYLDTRVHALMHEVLARGGAVGGSSAGASIQAEYMVRGHPLGNRVMMAEGYERGLGFLPGVAIDQHFAQRNRFPDMAKLKRRYPQLIGIGIDEGTFLVVHGRGMEVVGEHNVAVYDRSADDDDRDAFTILEPGARYDLVARRRVR